MRRPHVYVYITAAALLTALAAPAEITALFAFLAVALWGEWLALRLFGAPVEPVRERTTVGPFEAAYDPRRRLYHVFWRVEPVRTEWGIAAAPTLHEMYAQLALQPGEYLSIFQIGQRRYVRFTTQIPDARRIEFIEATLRSYFVTARERAWVSSKLPPPKGPAVAAAALVALGLLNHYLLPAALAFAYYAYVAMRWYREALEDFSFYTVTMKRDLGSSRQTLETFAHAEAAAAAKMERWAVVFAPRTEREVEREFGRAYESPVEKGGVVVKLKKTAELLERMIKYDERPIYLMAFGDRELHTQLEMRRSQLANVLFWTPRAPFMVKALSHDLARFPIFWGGKLLETGRKLEVGVDRFGRPVVVDIDSMPTNHAVILGPSGMGKSWTVATLLKRLARYKDLYLVIVDPHGDYLNLAEQIGAAVYRVPAQVPPLDPIRNNRNVPVLLDEFHVPPTDVLEDAVEYMAKSAGVEGVQYVEPPLNRHVVYDLRMLKNDAQAQAFFISLLLLWYLSAHSERPHAEALERIIVVDEAALLMRTARLTESGQISNVTLDLIRQYSMGGRKYGLAIWLIAQLGRHIPEDIMENAAFVIQLGGTRRALKRSAEVLQLDRFDMDYLRSATTPRETVGGMAADFKTQPYAMGVLLLSPRDILYHVKIPLDVELKQRR